MRAPGAFAFLLAATARNRLRLQFRRLRRPRHLVPVAAGAAYFGWVLFGQRGPGRTAVADALAAPGAEALVALVVAARAAAWWVFGSNRSALAFSPAEVQFLFPAPVARRDLLQFRILSVQLRVLVSVVLLGVLARRGPSVELALFRAAGIWTLLSTVHLHRLGASLARAGAVEHGAVGLRRNLVPLAVAGAGVAAVGWALAGAFGAPSFATDPFGALVGALEAPAAAAALYPFRLAVRPLFVVGTGPWLAAIGPALAVLALHYLWVLRSGVAFEDAAVEASARAAQRAARRGTAGAAHAPDPSRARRAARLPLAPTGVPAVALLWKNVLAAFRTLPLTGLLVTLGLVLAGTAVLSALPGYGRAARVAAIVALTWLFCVLLFGPQFVRNDLRQDLGRLPLLRSYPLRGRELVFAEIAAAAAVLTALAAPAIVTAYLGYLGAGARGGGPAGRAAACVAALVALPVVSACALVIQNAAALLFPSWVRLGPAQRSGGLEASGQNLVVTIASLAFLALLLAAPGAAGAGVAWLLSTRVGPWRAVPAAGVGAMLAVVELWWVAGWLGRLFERTEPGEIA